MKMDHYRRDGSNMYTKLLRGLVKFQVRMAGHCDTSGTGGGSGHCS